MINKMKNWIDNNSSMIVLDVIIITLGFFIATMFFAK